VIKFVSVLQQVGCFLWILLVSSTNEADCHDITEILLKVAFSTITLTLFNHRNSFRQDVTTESLIFFMEGGVQEYDLANIIIAVLIFSLDKIIKCLLIKKNILL
jgi:hypothetical protein